MDIRIVTEKLRLEIYGFGEFATNRDYAGTAFKLSGRMWEIVKAHHIKNKGKNIWVYETAHKVFAGVELDTPPESNFGLEKMTVEIGKYAYFKHVGPYNHIQQAGQNMTSELMKRGYEIILPYIEIYGHWTSDENLSETELIMSLR